MAAGKVLFTLGVGGQIFGENLSGGNGKRTDGGGNGHTDKTGNHTKIRHEAALRLSGSGLRRRGRLARLLAQRSLRAGLSSYFILLIPYRSSRTVMKKLRPGALIPEANTR